MTTTSVSYIGDLLPIVGESMTHLRDTDLGDHRSISVEIGLPTYGGSVLGEFILGTSLLSGMSWYPVTDRWTGASIDRGSQDDSANVGTATITLDNADGSMSPWSTTFPNDARAYAAPGTLIRISFGYGYREAVGVTNVLPIFTGVVESWTVAADPISGVSEVVITAVETTSQLAGVNDLALVSPVGSGDITQVRIARLLDAAGWPFGAVVDGAVADAEHQSTVMAQDRLSELYLTATSAGLVFRADVHGRALLTTETSVLSWTISEADLIDAGTLTIANDDALIVNVLNLGNTGGTEQTFTNDVSIGRHGRRTGGRSDLNLTPPSTDLEFLATPELARSSFTLRPVSFDFDHARSPVIAQTADLGVGITLTTLDGVVFTGFRIVGLHHEIAPVGADDLAWTLTVSLAPSSTSTVTLP